MAYLAYLQAGERIPCQPYEGLQVELASQKEVYKAVESHDAILKKQNFHTR